MPKADGLKLGTAARVAAAARRRHEKWAAEMREYGWDCTPPTVENTPVTSTEDPKTSTKEHPHP
jgi:hypothetical protein